MIARKGKIARLPRSIRNELNVRLENGAPGQPLLDWLNSLPGTRQVLQEQFDGVPISKQNLSDWRQGGYAEWLARRDLLDQATDMAEQATELEETTDCLIVDHVVTVLAARYAALLAGWNGEPDPQFESRQQLLGSLARDLGRLQRTMHHARAQNLKFEQQREEEEKLEFEDRRKQSLQIFKARLHRKELIEIYGGGSYGEWVVDTLDAIEYDLPWPKFPGKKPARQAKSSQVVPEPVNEPVKPDPVPCPSDTDDRDGFAALTIS